MKNSKHFFLRFMLTCMVLLCAFRAADVSSVTIVGCTPADNAIRSILHLAQPGVVDFIRWNIKLDRDDSYQFTMNLQWGESLQGTPGFKNGGLNQTIAGTYSVRSQSYGANSKNIYTLVSTDKKISIRFVQLDDNVFHILDTGNNLLVGNGGWSYSLTRNNPRRNTNTRVVTLSDKQQILHDRSATLTFIGRTPCNEIMKDHHWAPGAGRTKLKWKIVLKRDPRTYQPDGYTMRRVDEHANDTSGSWEIVQAKDAIYYKLSASSGNDFLTLLVVDNNVLYFVNAEQNIYPGNSDFAYALSQDVGAGHQASGASDTVRIK